MALFEWWEQTSAITSLRESSWSFPLLGALHVAALAWLGLGLLRTATPRLRHWSTALLIATGTTLFLLQPSRYAANPLFLLKLLLIATAITFRNQSWAPILWIATMLAARAIAYF